MLVKAKHGVKYDGIWYKAGEEFEVSLTDADRMADMVDALEESLHADTAAEDLNRSDEARQSAGRGRKKSS